MKNIDQLWIRACKSKDRFKRLNSVYRRFYLNDPNDYDIANLLSLVVEKYNLMTARDLMVAMQPSQRMVFGLTSKNDYYSICKHVLASHIGLTEVNKLPGLIPPARFRSNHEQTTRP